MWEISNNTQITSFLVSLLFGVLFCIGYDFLRALRRAGLDSVLAITLQDVAYSVVVAFVTFLLMLVYACGEIRFYILVAVFLGFLIFNFTLSPFLIKLLTFILKKIFIISTAVFFFISKKFTAVCRNLRKILRKIENYLKNRAKSSKNNLKDKS